LLFALFACSGGRDAPRLVVDPAGDASPSVDWAYTLDVSPALDAATVTLCFPGRVPDALMPGTTDGVRAVLDMHVVGGAALAPGSVVDLDEVARGGCVRWRLDPNVLDTLGNARVDPPDGVHAWWPAAWLWRPTEVPADVRATVTVRGGPPGMEVSTPWPRGAGGAFELDASAFERRSRFLIGDVDLRRWSIAGGTVELALLGSLDASDAAIERWVRIAIEGAADVYGGFPSPYGRIQICVVPQRGRSVGFGMTQRGGGGGVILWVGRSASDAALTGDWTLAHEVFHLGMPSAPRGDAWFTEGITTYYTYVARARVGGLTPQAAWDDLHDGFMRGRGQGARRTLLEESAEMGRTGRYWWVYWGGAAWALLADLELRAGGSSLDAVLRDWNRCCVRPGRQHTPRSLLRRADAADLWASARQALESRAFPPVERAYRALGLEPVDRSRVRLVDRPEPAARRRAIMRGE
jgi:predicted metalloprotease with PDZ domain